MAGSFKTDILPMFRAEDIECMNGYGVPLDSYEWISKPDNAKNVYLHLNGKRQPRMPEGGPYWSKEMLDRFNTWMSVDPKLQP
ncbi:MAG TPA: hypothetical protein VKB93_09470 [Thermoanaerobaculia bacterium]|nr:hypothetical protein [Thermoanaerobaculia bacterium]